MTGKERLGRTLAHKPSDRPPFDFWAEDASVRRLFAHIGHDDLDAFLDDMHVDIRGVDATFKPQQHIGDGIYQNQWGERYRFVTHPYGQMRDDVPGALSLAESFEDIRAFNWPTNDETDYAKLAQRIDALAAKGCAIRYGSADIWQRPMLVRGFEHALLDLYEHPEWIHYMCELFTRFYIEDYARAWELSRGRIDMFLVISDLGSQSGPLISRPMFHAFVAPYLDRIAKAIHHMGAKVLFHSCGMIAPFIDDLIALGVDVLDPIQPVNDAMQPERLRPYAKRICLHGGIDMQRLLPCASPDQIKQEVRRYSELLSPGYIVSPAHYFQPDVPPENIMAVYQAFSETRRCI